MQNVELKLELRDPDLARAILRSLGVPVRVVVKKRREVYMAGQVRVHLDEVEGLGRFLEFEALISPRQTAGAGQSAIADLRDALAPALGEPIGVGYADMLAPPRGEHPPA